MAFQYQVRDSFYWGATDIWLTDPLLQMYSAICLVATLWITNQAKYEFITLWMIIVLSLLYPIYLVATAVVGLYGHTRHVSRYTSWNTTARG